MPFIIIIVILISCFCIGVLCVSRATGWVFASFCHILIYICCSLCFYMFWTLFFPLFLFDFHFDFLSLLLRVDFLPATIYRWVYCCICFSAFFFTACDNIRWWCVFVHSFSMFCLVFFSILCLYTLYMVPFYEYMALAHSHSVRSRFDTLFLFIYCSSLFCCSILL